MAPVFSELIYVASSSSCWALSFLQATIGVSEYYPLVLAHKYLPNWAQSILLRSQLRRHHEVSLPSRSIRQCQGTQILNLYCKGHIQCYRIPSLTTIILDRTSRSNSARLWRKWKSEAILISFGPKEPAQPCLPRVLKTTLEPVLFGGSSIMMEALPLMWSIGSVTFRKAPTLRRL